MSLKKHLLQFQKIGFILKVSLEKTLSTIPQNPICIEGVSSHLTNLNLYYILMNLILSLRCFLKRHFLQFQRDTFYDSKKIEFILKVSLKRHFSQFHKFQYILLVSFQEMSSTISQILIYIMCLLTLILKVCL